jgi:phosphocarrier protein HPr
MSTRESAEGTFEIVNELGLHARAAAKLVRLAEGFTSTIEVAKEGQRADAKSIMGLLLLCGIRGSKLTVRASGADAAEAIQAIGELIGGRFGEER